MQSFMKGKVTTLHDLTKSSREIYQTLVVEPDVTNTAGLQDVKEKTTKVDKATQELDKALKDFNKGEGADLKNLAAGCN